MAKTIVGKLIASIFGEFKRNWPSFVAKLIDKVPDDVREKVSIGIKIVDKFNDWINSPIADFLLTIIPGEKDKEIRDKISHYLANLTDLIDKYDLTYGGDRHLVASKINAEITGMTFGQSALTTEVVYQSMKKNGEVA